MLHPLATRAVLLLTLSISWSHNAVANVIGTDSQNFNPTTSGLHFLTVHSSETLAPGQFSLGLFANYATNTLPEFAKTNDRWARKHPENWLLGSDVLMGVGLWDNLEAGLTVPSVLHQKVSDEANLGTFARNGYTELRVNLKARLYHTEVFGFAIVGSTNFNQIEDYPYSGENPAPIHNVELVADARMGPIMMATNLGYRWRKPGEKLTTYPVDPYDSQYLGSAALKYQLTERDGILYEVYGSSPVGAPSVGTDRHQSAVENNLSYRRKLDYGFQVDTGVGTELANGNATPDLRIFAGIYWRNQMDAPQSDDGDSDVDEEMVPDLDEEQDGEPAEEEVEAISADFAEGPEADLAADPGNPFANATVMPKEHFVIEDALFAYDSYELQDKTRTLLRQLVDHLNKPPGFTTLVIDGHTCSMGSDQYNQQLSTQRARAIRQALIDEHQIDPSKVQAKGYGESSPVASNEEEAGRQLNRRVEFTILRPNDSADGDSAAEASSDK